MNQVLKFGVLAFCLTFLSAGCSTFGIDRADARRSVRRMLGYPEDPYLRPIALAPKAYAEAFESLEAGKYEDAIKGFSEFLRDQPTTNWTLAAQFNWGRALESLNRYTEAAAKYQETAEGGKLVPKLQGLALLRMAVVLEAMGEDARSLAALKDSEKRAAQMSPEIAQTELPARLAAAYARERNFREAEKYFLMADKSLARLRSQAGSDLKPEWLPRVLYAMGHRPLAPVPWNRFDEHVLPLERSQTYLLQSAEMGAEPWASRSAIELIDAYKALRSSIDTVPTPAASEMILAAREQQRERWKRLIRLGDAVAKLRALFVSEVINSAPLGSPVRMIAEFADELEESVQSALLLERPAGEIATPESLKRKENPRGHVIDAKPAFPGEGG